MDDFWLGWSLGGLFDSLCEFISRWWHVIVVAVIIIAVAVGVYYARHRADDSCRAKGGTPIHTTDRGTVCIEGRELR